MLPSPDELRLRIHPDRALRVKTGPVSEVTDEIRALADRMIELMRESDGIGLAAPQVGLDIRMFVADVPEDPESIVDEFPPELVSAHTIEMSTDGPRVYINPEIEFLQRSVSPFNEGCLSLPDIRGDVLRPEVVRLKALDDQGREVTHVGGGLLSRCWQHETDHLNGILIIDKMHPMHLRSNSKRIRELERSR